MNSFCRIFRNSHDLCFGSGVFQTYSWINKRKQQRWIVISFGGQSVYLQSAYSSRCKRRSSNPAVTLALWLPVNFLLPWCHYISLPAAGAMFGSGLAWLAYKKHFDATDDADAKMAVFCTSPNIRVTGIILRLKLSGHISCPGSALHGPAWCRTRRLNALLLPSLYSFRSVTWSRPLCN